MTSFIRAIAIVIATSAVACCVRAETIVDPATQTCPLYEDAIDASLMDFDVSQLSVERHDRVWLLSSRHLTSNASRVNVQDPKFNVYRLDECGKGEPILFEKFESLLGGSRPLVIYVHGNLIESADAVSRGMTVYREIRRCRTDDPIDWLIWSWPSDKYGCRWINDFREKADRTDAQGLYLAWFLRRRVHAAIPMSVIGYSFGARVISGSLHALAGGRLGGRCLGGRAVVGAPISAGWIAPAVESTWLCSRGYHGRATKNLESLLLLYSRRDLILKRYWLIDRIRSSVALGYSGPQTFGPRADGSRLPVRSRDCASAVGFRHRELEYYQQNQCNARAEMAKLINAKFQTQGK